MKNKFLSIVSLFLLLLMPLQISASTDYEAKNLKETLAAEEIELAYPDYKETDDQITIYMFRGNTCGYCKAFLTFLNSITEEYGKYFKLESYEVWSNQKNGELMQEVGEFLGEQAGGVPFIIIGDKVFPGYNEVYDEDIKAAIKDLYDSNNRYDVFKEMKKAKLMEKINSILSKVIPVVSVIGLVVVSIYVNKNNKLLTARINELEEKITTLDEKATKQEKNVEKKTAKKAKTTKKTDKKTEK